MDAETKAALADVYEKAAEYLEKRGWIQESYYSAKGEICLRSALSLGSDAEYIVSGNALTQAAAKFLCDALELGHPDAVENWNDDPRRTKDEVINTLHALANKLR